MMALHGRRSQHCVLPWVRAELVLALSGQVNDPLLVMDLDIVMHCHRWTRRVIELRLRIPMCTERPESAGCWPPSPKPVQRRDFRGLLRRRVGDLCLSLHALCETSDDRALTN